MPLRLRGFCKSNFCPILTGHSKKHREELLAESNFVTRDIYEAAVWLIKDKRNKKVKWYKKAIAKKIEEKNKKMKS